MRVLRAVNSDGRSRGERGEYEARMKERTLRDRKKESVDED